MLARHSRGLPPLYPSPSQADERTRLADELGCVGESLGDEVFREPGGGNLIGSGNQLYMRIDCRLPCDRSRRDAPGDPDRSTRGVPSVLRG